MAKWLWNDVLVYRLSSCAMARVPVMLLSLPPPHHAADQSTALSTFGHGRRRQITKRKKTKACQELDVASNRVVLTNGRCDKVDRTSVQHCNKLYIRFLNFELYVASNRVVLTNGRCDKVGRTSVQHCNKLYIRFPN